MVAIIGPLFANIIPNQQTLGNLMIIEHLILLPIARAMASEELSEEKREDSPITKNKVC
ncbi:MAG: hypothetical protein WBX81_00855 [Nitrososphaeraceae archaeon]